MAGEPDEDEAPRPTQGASCPIGGADPPRILELVEFVTDVEPELPPVPKKDQPKEAA